MIHTDQPDTASATAPVRREWRAPDLRELPADATALATPGAPVDGPFTS